MAISSSLTPVANPFLYILMRTDLASMNAGKAVAHGAHAANQFEHIVSTSPSEDMRRLYTQWKEQAHFFGTTITLEVNERQLRQTVEVLKANGYCAGVIHDPTYPLRDGDVTHLIPLDTCGFAFGDKNAMAALLDHLELMK